MIYVATIVYYANNKNSKKIIADADFNKLLIREEKEIGTLKQRNSNIKVHKVIYEYPSGKTFVKNF